MLVYNPIKKKGQLILLNIFKSKILHNIIRLVTRDAVSHLDNGSHLTTLMQLFQNLGKFIEIPSIIIQFS